MSESWPGEIAASDSRKLILQKKKKKSQELKHISSDCKKKQALKSLFNTAIVQ